MDGIDVRGEQRQYYDVLTTAPPGTRIAFGLARGVTVAITYRRYEPEED